VRLKLSAMASPDLPLAMKITSFLNLVILVLALALMLWAFIHAALQRRDAYAAIGGLQKQHWLGLLGVLFLLSIVIGFLFVPIIYVGIGAAAFYLLDTRRGLKDVSEGPW
jgi:4-amino-4-deoxy-L-arabinose transferase-like glycosyltransferase